VIFPAAYLNSPSSMFGHTLLRVDQQGQTASNILLAYTINYAANANQNDNELVYAFRGLFGGYPGGVSVLPYYQKVKEYGALENRDIWEYKLNLSTDEVRFVLLHTWELKDRYFDYYFFDENCAYRVLTLVEVARPELDLVDRFNTHAIPANTVRALVEQGIVESVTYRPSRATLLEHRSQSLPKTEQLLARQLGYENSDRVKETLKPLAEDRQAAIYDVAYAYQRYQAKKQEWSREHIAEKSHQLLKERSQLAATQVFEPVPEPAIRDDQGHHTNEWSLKAGRYDSVDYVETVWRPAYHDLHDPVGGYPLGAQIKFLETALRYQEGGHFRLQQLTGLNITSLTPRTIFLNPLSWQVDLGLYRRDTRRDQDNLMPRLSFAGGLTYLLDSGFTLYGLAGASAEVDRGLEKGYVLSPKLTMGLLYNKEHWHTAVNVSSWYGAEGESGNHQQLSATVGYHFSRDTSVYVEYSHEHTVNHHDKQGLHLKWEWRY
jgi:hypothetical protein